MAADPHPHPMAGFPGLLVEQVLADARAHGCRVYAIAGLQGTGKSTLADQVAWLAAREGLAVATLSIDDFYLDRAARQRLGREVHPLCALRGVPGTHEVALACDVLDALRDGRAVSVPRFDKLADDRLPRDRWTRIDRAGLVIFEGWFLKVPAQRESELATPLNALERDEDPEGTWRRWSNAALVRDYPALWTRLQRLLFLQAPGFGIVPHWRWQQEQALQAAHPEQRAMSRPQLDRFVQCFERVSRQVLRTLPTIAERTLPLDADRRPLSAL